MQSNNIDRIWRALLIVEATFIMLFISMINTQCQADEGDDKYIHTISISRHWDQPFSDGEADNRLNSASHLLQIINGPCPDEVGCCVELTKDGQVMIFGQSGDGLDIIDNEVEKDIVFSQLGHFKVLKEIHNCGGLQGDFLGCGKMGAPNSIVVANASAAVWAHEFGHNQGLPHRNDCSANIMHESASGTNSVNETECEAFKSGGITDGSKCSNAPIPTLSEWKRIFLTLLMLSLVMGFMRVHAPKFGLADGSDTVHGTNSSNLLAFDRRLFFSVMKWIGPAVVLGLSGATVICGGVSILDITGTLFCAPLVAYILHLVISFIRDYDRIP